MLILKYKNTLKYKDSIKKIDVELVGKTFLDKT